MFKLTGAVMIAAACALWGILRSENLKRRALCLEKIVYAMKLLENDIMYEKRDIKISLKSAGRTQGVALFENAAEKMENEGAEKAFDEAVEVCGEYLLGTDKEILKEFAENLGMSGKEEQLKRIRGTSERLENAKVNAETEYEKSGKLYRGMGALIGAAAVILLL